MEHYIISEKTLAVIGLNRKLCQIIEEEQEFFVEESWEKILDDSCLYYGASFQGRIEGSRKILNREYKVPIVVSEAKRFLFFPIGKLTPERCAWISLNKLKYYDECGEKIKFIFEMGKTLYIEVGRDTLETQLLKAYNLERFMFPSI